MYPCSINVTISKLDFGRYGYRMTTGLLKNAGWHLIHKRVERSWRREGPKVPLKQAKKGKLWLNNGLCVRLRPDHANHVWSYDFVHDRTHDGRVFRTLNIIDELTKEALVIRVKRKLNSIDVVDALRPYLDHSILELDNNAAERAMRAVALGRKNYLFVGSEASCKAAAIAYTLIEAAKLNAIDLHTWLADTLARIPDYKITKVDDLLPWRWNG